MTLRERLTGAVVMAPMTKGSNLPYRRLCVELGARVTLSEMTVARRLKQRRKGEFALIRRAPGEACFGVQLAGTNPDEMAWAAALVEERGADFVDVNFGCPIDHFTRKGLGAAMGRQPRRMQRIIESMKRAVQRIPVTGKIRLGWSDEDRNFLDQAKALEAGGADAITVHGRTRNARYRLAADWDAIGQVVAAVGVPVVGNGDILFPHEIEEARARSGAVAVMAARGVLIKPWLFREATDGYRDIGAEARLAVYRRYVALALEHWGADAHGQARVREFLRWHAGFWCRYAGRRADGSWPSMQHREPGADGRTSLEDLLARSDGPALDFVTDSLLAGLPIEPAKAPSAQAVEDVADVVVEG
ncbi:MAG: tRNA-dihydrouridine synthase family protein [Vicinamibacterales bacterium]